MIINSYVQIEEINGAEIYQLQECNYPARELMKFEAVDIKAYRENLRDKLKDKSIPLKAVQFQPLLPSRFEYYSPQAGKNRVVEGIVYCEDAVPLLKFCENNLVNVADNLRLNQLLTENTDSDRMRVELIEDMKTNHSASQNPYFSYPCVLLDLSERTEAMEFFKREGDESKLLFISGECLNHYHKNIRRYPCREVISNQLGKGERRSYTGSRARRYQPLYSAPRQLDFEDRAGKDYKIERLDFVIGINSNYRKSQKISSYLWSYKGKRGLVLDPDTLPLGLLENIDASGRQCHRSQGLPEPMPVNFIKPRRYVASDFTDLDQYTEKTIDREELPGECEWLDRRWFVNDLRDSINSSFLEGIKYKKSKVDVDSKKMAYILQRTKNGVYDPEHNSAVFEIPAPSGSAVACTLGEVSL